MTNFGNNDPTDINNDRRRDKTTIDETATPGYSDVTRNKNRNRANNTASSKSSMMIPLAIAAAVVIGALLWLSNDRGTDNSQVSQTSEQGNDASSSTANSPAPVTPTPTAPATNP